MKQQDDGFTLIELLIVIVILGILAAVVVFAVGGITQDAKANACLAEERTVETAVESYRADTGSYPADTAAIVGTADGFLRDTPTYWGVAPAAEGVAAEGVAAGSLVGVGDNINNDCSGL